MARTIILSLVCLFVGIINAKQMIGVANADELNELFQPIEIDLEQSIKPQAEMRDPTEPLSWTKGSQQVVSAGYRPALQSIICGDNNCHAIIDGRLLKRGQSINGYYVHSITPKKVVLTKEGTVWNLELFSSIIKN